MSEAEAAPAPVGDPDNGVMTCDQAYTKAGGFGRYQIFTLIILAISLNGPGMVTYGIAFYQLDPPYICTYVDAVTLEDGTVEEVTTLEECTFREVCDFDGSKADGRTITAYQIDTDGEKKKFYLQNWVEQMNLQCTPKSYIGLIGSLAFVGAAISCFFLPAAGDVYGRYATYMVVSWLQIPFYFMLIYTNSFGVLYLVCFMFGMCLLGRFANAFILITESVPNKDKAFMGTALITLDALATFYVIVFVRYITNSTVIIVWIGVAMNILACIVGLWQCESPPWLLSVGEKEKAIKNMKYIAKWNGHLDLVLTDLIPDPTDLDGSEDKAVENKPTSIQQNDPDEIVAEKAAADKDAEKAKNDKPIGFCSNPKIFCTLIIFIIFWASSSFDYYIITYMLKYIPGNIYVNTTISATSEIAANLVSGYLMKTMGIKSSMVIAYVCSTAGGVLMICFYSYESAMAGFVLLAKFGISIAFNNVYLATPMAFPTALTGTAFGICNVVARVATVLSPLIAETPFPAPMVSFSLVAIIAGISSLFVQELKEEDKAEAKKVEDK